MTRKTCFKCGEEKSIDEFYRHPRMLDGHLGKCKECAKIDTRDNYRLRHEQYLKYEKERMRLPHRVEARRNYSQTENGRNAHKKSRRKYAETYPEKRLASTKTSNAIRDGRLIRLPCVVCGDTNVQAHHPDYSRPLEVIWLCRQHHLEVHGKRLLCRPF